MAPKLVRQPPGSSLCGQSCVATVAGITLEESISEFRSRGCTKTKQVKKVLEQHGFKCGNKLKVICKKNPLPERCIAKVKFKGTNRNHWVVIWDGQILDPDFGVISITMNPHDDAWISSFLEIS